MVHFKNLQLFADSDERLNIATSADNEHDNFERRNWSLIDHIDLQPSMADCYN